MSRPFARNSGSTFCQSVSGYHSDTYRMNKFFYRQRYSRSGCRKQVTIFYTDSLLKQAIDSLLVEFIFQMKQCRRSLAVHQISDIMLLTYFQGIQHQVLFESGSFVYLFQHSCINLFPETRNTTHGGRTNFLDSLLNILRAQVYSKLTTS